MSAPTEQERYRDPAYVAEWVLSELHTLMPEPYEGSGTRPIPYDVGSASAVQDYVDLNEMVLKTTERAGYKRGGLTAEYVISYPESCLAEQAIAIIDERLRAEAAAVGEYEPMAASEFVAHMATAGVAEAELYDHGLGPVPTGTMPDGSWVCLSSFDGGLVQGEDLPPLVSLIRYESAHVSQERWGEGKGLDFNDPTDCFDGTPVQALARLQAWIGEGVHLPAIGTIRNAQGQPIVYGMVDAGEYPLTATCTCPEPLPLYRGTDRDRWVHEVHVPGSPLVQVPAPKLTVEPRPGGVVIFAE